MAIETALIQRTREIQGRSRLNQNVIIDQSGLRIGRKIWIRRELLPLAIQNAERAFCLALRGPIDLENLLQKISQDADLLAGKKQRAVINGVVVTSEFNRVLLIAPDFQRVRKFVSPSLGLERIAAYLRHVNEAVDVVTVDPNLIGEVTDGEAAGQDDIRLARNRLVKIITDGQFDLVGFSVLTPTLPNDIGNIARIGSVVGDYPKRPLFIMGNYGVLLGAEELFNATQFLDAVVWGPGEYPMAAIIGSLQQLRGCQEPLETLRSAALYNALSADFQPAVLAIRDRKADFPKGQLFPSVSGEQLTELQRLVDQYAISYEEHWLTFRGLPKVLRFHLSTTSCPYQCIFCSTTKGKLQFVPIETAVELFRHARRAYPEVRRFSFTDDNLFIDKDYLRRLAEGIRQTPEWERGLGLYCMCRADSVKPADETLLLSLRETGFDKIAIGVESYSKTSLAELRKGIRPEQAHEIIRALTEAGIDPVINLILFPPNITLMCLYETLEQALEISRDPRLHIDPNMQLAAYSGAPLTKAIEERQTALPSRRLAILAGEGWVQATEIVYTTIGNTKVPSYFKIIRKVMEKLCDTATTLCQKATSATKTDPNNLGRRGLIRIWAIIAIVAKNLELFSDSSAGAGSQDCLNKVIGLAAKFREVIRIRYPEEAETIFAALDKLEIPKL